MAFGAAAQTSPEPQPDATAKAAEPERRPPLFGSERARWILFWVGAGVLAAGAGAIVYWQNRRVAVLYDLSYILEHAWRIAAGDVPYKDFPLPHAPGTFLIQALLIRLFDSTATTHILYAVVVGAASVLLTARILYLQLRGRAAYARALAVVLSVPLVVVNVYALFPHAFYDPDACFFILLALWAVLEARARACPRNLTLVAGAATVLPLFVKQNIGLPFFAATHVLLALMLFDQDPRVRRGWRYFAAGAVGGLLLALTLIAATSGLSNYYHWTFDWAVSRRLPRLKDQFPIYDDPPALLWIGLTALAAVAARWIPRRLVALAVAGVLVAVPWLWLALSTNGFYRWRWERNFYTAWPFLLGATVVVGVVTLARRELSFEALLPGVAFAVCHGAFMSQGLVGSSYGIGPMLSVMAAGAVATLVTLGRDRGPFTGGVLATLFALATFLVGGDQVYTNGRVRFADVVGPYNVASTHPRLKGLTSGWDYLAQVDRMLSWVERNIPQDAGVVAVPGEDPFFFALRRKPKFPVLLFERSTVSPYDFPELPPLFEKHGIDWVVFKDRLQIGFHPVPPAEFLPLLAPQFELVYQDPTYRIFRRRPKGDQGPAR